MILHRDGVSQWHCTASSYQKGGMIRLETLVELKFPIRVVRVYPLIETRQTSIDRAIRADSISINSILPPSLLHRVKLAPWYGQTANEDPRKSEFESQRILNVEGGLS